MELDFHKDPAILSTVIDAMADGVFTVDAQGRFVAWSKGAERITGYSQKDVIGKPCNLLEGPNCKGFATLNDLLGNPTPETLSGICNQECKLFSKAGKELYIHGNVRLIADSQGKVAGAVGSFTDLTSFIVANEKIALLEEQTRQRDAFQKIVGKSEPMQEVFRRLRLAAHSDVTVFISGESGTGKELAARAIHSLSDRSSRPFIAVNCSAIPETLLESELFGHVKGAFTGAVKDKTGMFQAAEGGTLFLDEIGDVSPLLQLKLLRVLQEREVRRVGDERPQPVNVRLLTATNRDLKALIGEGTFREDFYYRIRVFEINLPPLRERKDDIPVLVQRFIEELNAVYHRKVNGVARDAMSRLMEHEWPGNIRELRNAIEHAFVTVQGESISLLDLPEDVRAPAPPAPPRTPETSSRTDTKTRRRRPLSIEEEAEREQLEKLLDAAGGNKTEVARQLGISRVTMWKKSRKYNL